MCVFYLKHTLLKICSQNIKNSPHARKRMRAVLYSGAESNRYQKFRKLLFYPLNYRSIIDRAKLRVICEIGK